MARHEHTPWLAIVCMLAACDATDASPSENSPAPPLAGAGAAAGMTATQPAEGSPMPTNGTMMLPTTGAGEPASAGTSASPPTAGAAAAGDADAGVAAGAGGASAGDAAADAGEGVSADGGSGAVSSLPPVSDYTTPGPFSTTMESSTGPGSNYTIFRPDPLGVDGFVHAPIIFGPGILTSPNSYRTLLDHLASHGFVSIVVNSLSAGPGSAVNVEAMREGLDWLLSQNSQPGVYQGMLAETRAVTMGYSLGATASVQLSSHEAVLTTVSIHGHNTSGDPHGPVLLLTGTDDVIDSVRQTFSTLEEAPAMLAALPIGHLAVLSELSASGRYVGPITAWLRYFINGDENAKRFFWGGDCEMCSSPWITPETNAAWDAQML